MKKITALLLVLTCLIWAGCSRNEDEMTTAVTDDAYAAEEQTEEETVSTVAGLGLTEIDPRKVLTVYFSHNDEVGEAASFVAAKTDGGIYRIETETAYPDDRGELMKKAQEQHSRGVRPALKGAPESMKDYDIIFLCFPEWDGTMPMAVWTFIEDYDMRDKAVIPVCEGSTGGLERAIEDIFSIEPEMTIVDGYCYEDGFGGIEEEFGEFIYDAVHG